MRRRSGRGAPDHRLHARLRRRLREHDGRPSISTSSPAPTTCAARRGDRRSRTSSSSWASAISRTATSRACPRASSSASRSAAPSIHDPQVLILDEPAANLDPRARIEFRTLIRELAADGKTILLSSHILTELAEMCDVVAVIEKGRILATGTVQDDPRAACASGGSCRCGSPAPYDGVERFLLEQPGVSNVHEAGGRAAVRVRRRRRRAGVAGRAAWSAPGFRCSSSAPTAPGSRICSSRSPKDACNEPAAGAPRPARATRAIGSARSSSRKCASWCAGASSTIRSAPACWSGLAVAFFGAADALTRQRHVGQRGRSPR